MIKIITIILGKTALLSHSLPWKILSDLSSSFLLFYRARSSAVRTTPKLEDGSRLNLFYLKTKPQVVSSGFLEKD
jgi:hypothetical protein